MGDQPAVGRRTATERERRVWPPQPGWVWLHQKRDFFEFEVMDFSHDGVFHRAAIRGCKANDELCRARTKLSLIKKKRHLAFQAARTDESRRAFNKLKAEREKQEISEEENLHLFYLYVPRESDASKTEVGVKLRFVRIASQDLDGVRSWLTLDGQEAEGIQF